MNESFLKTPSHLALHNDGLRVVETKPRQIESLEQIHGGLADHRMAAVHPVAVIVSAAIHVGGDAHEWTSRESDCTQRPG
jgi:hypothetical protein